jgi:hypothetical protein
LWVLVRRKDRQKGARDKKNKKKSHILPENFGVLKEGVIFAPRKNQNGGFI